MQPPASPAAAPTVAFYSYRFLARTMTFNYRLLLNVAEYYRTVVFTTLRESASLFPYEPIYVRPFHPVRRLVDNILRDLAHRQQQLRPEQVRSFVGIGRDEGVRLVHAHFGPGALQALPLAKELGVPMLASFHGYDASRSLESEAYRRALQPLFDYAQITVASERMGEALIGVGADPEQIHVSYYGIPLEQFRLLERPPPRERRAGGLCFLQVAGFAEKKGHRYTLEAFARLLEDAPDSRLTFVGGGGGERALRKLAERLGIAHATTFVGWVDAQEVQHHLAEADVFVHHSVTARDGDQEGIPNALIEAMATGLPVISTFHAGIPELVEDGVSGRLVEERDVPAYAACMREALEWDESLGRAARKRIEERFDIRLQAARVAALYAGMLGEAGARAEEA